MNRVIVACAALALAVLVPVLTSGADEKWVIRGNSKSSITECIVIPSANGAAAVNFPQIVVGDLASEKLACEKALAIRSKDAETDLKSCPSYEKNSIERCAKHKIKL